MQPSLQVSLRVVDKEGEEEQYRDLTFLMELLKNLFDKVFINLSPSVSGDAVEEVNDIEMHTVQ